MKKSLISFLVLAMISLVSGFGINESKAGDGYVGISMPTKSSERWIKDGESMKKILEERGYKVDLQYAEDDIPTQKSQIENMIVKGVNVLVIAAIDGSTLSSTLDQAAKDGIKVISYDRLLVNTDAVSYYATFDNFLVGVQQANSLVTGLKERFKPPYNIELFGGSPDDTNSGYFWNGAMSVLQPMIDKGEIVVVSGQTDFDQGATLRWDGAVAQQRMDALLTANYSDGTTKVQGVLSPYDGISVGIISSLKSGGYTVDSGEFPIVSGQDAEAASVKLIRMGEQYATIFKDTRVLAEVAANMVDSVLKGFEPEINDTKTYNNNVKIVPSFLCEPYIIYNDDIQELIIGSGYLTEDDLK